MKDLSPDTNRLLERARGASALPPERRAQIKARLMTQIAAGGALATATTVTASSKAAWLYSPVAKGLALFTVISSVGTGAYFAWQASHETTPNSVVSAHASRQTPSVSNAGAENLSPKAAAATSAGVTTAEPPAPTSAGEPAVNGAPAEGSQPSEPGSVAARTSSPSTKAVSPSKAVAAAPQVASVASAPVTADSLAEETRLIREADQALRAGNASRALSLLSEHATRFPRGALAAGRNGERLIARCKLGQVDRAALDAYLSAHPGSAFSARIHDACAAR